MSKGEITNLFLSPKYSIVQNSIASPECIILLASPLRTTSSLSRASLEVSRFERSIVHLSILSPWGR